MRLLRRIPLKMTLAAVLLPFAGTGTGAVAETEQPLAIVDATIFDATGAAPYIGTVVVREGRIAQIGPDVAVPKGAQVVRARGKALLPGLFDLHTHWTPGSTPGTYPQIATAYLATGVTTVNDFHQPPESFEPRRRWLSTLYAPHVNLTARMSTPLGHGADWADENTTRWVNSPDAARRAVDAIAEYKPDLIKAFTDGWRYGMSADNTSMSVDTLSALVDQAHGHGLRVLTHTVTVERGRQAGEAKVDVIAHSLQDRPIDAETIAAIKAGGTYYAPTLAVYEPVKPGQEAPFPADDPRMRQREQKFGYALGNAKALHDAGVPVAVGTDAGMFPHQGATARELELLVRAGLTPAEALIAGTATSAAAIGLQDDRGTLRPGLRADLVLVDGRPWEDIAAVRRVERVFVDGRQVWGNGVKTSAANQATAMPAVRIAALVDDFERADGRTALDTLRVDEADGGTDRTVQVTEVVAREQAGHALSLQARFSSKPEPFASAILPLSRGSVEPVDLRGYRGLRFEIRGDARPVTLEYRGVENRRWSHRLQPQAGWRTVEVRFDALQGQPSRRGEGPVPAWKGDDLQQLVFSIGGEPGEKVWLELDNVAFY